MKRSSTQLRQELRLKQTQLRLNGTEQEKLQATVSNLNKQYEVAKQRTKETAEQLERTKQQFGENSNEAKRMETELRRAQIAEQSIANQLEITTQRLDEAKRAEAERTSEVGKAKENLKQLQQEEERLAQTSDNLTKKFEAEKAALGNNASETSKAKLEYDHLQEAKKVAGEQTENLRKQLENAKTAYGENSKEVRDLEGKLYDAVKAEQEIINKSQELQKRVGNALKVAGSHAKEFGDKMQEAGRKATDVGKSLSMKVTAPITAFGALAVRTGMKFESSMSEVAAISGSTGKDLEDLEKKAREMGAATSFSASEAAEGLKYMALAGWENEKMLAGIGPVLSLAEAGSLDLGRASDLVTDSMAALGVEVDDLEDYLDKVAQTASSANTDIDALMEAMIVTGGKFREFNVPLEEANTMLGVLANRGLKGSQAGTAMNAIMTRLTQSSGPAAKGLEELGLSAFDSEGNFRGMETVLKDVNEKIKDKTDEERSAILTSISGQNHSKALSAILAGLGDEYDELKDSVTDSNGALQEMRDVMKDNLGGRLENLSSAFEELQIKIYEALLPTLEKVIGAFQKIVDWMNNTSPAARNVVIVLAAIAAAIGPLLIVFGQLSIWIGGIVKLFGGLASVIGGISGGAGMLGGALTMLKTVLVALTGPVGIVIGVITILVGIFVRMYQVNEEFREKVNEVWSAITEKIGLAIEHIKEFIMEIFGQVVDWWNENNESIRQATENVWEWIQTFLGVVFDVILGIFQFIWPLIEFIIVDTWNAIKNVIQGAVNVILGIIDFFVALFTGDWEGLWEATKQILSGAVQLIWGLINLWFVGKILKLGKSFVKLFQGIFTNSWKFITNLFTRSVSGVRNTVSSGFNAVRNLISNIMNGIRNVISSIWNGIRSTISNVVNGIRSTVSNVFGSIRNTASNVFSAVRDRMVQPIQKARDLIKSAIDRVKGFFSGMKLKFPKISMPKLPRFSLEGKFNLMPPSVPKLKINWNAQGGIFTRPTIFNTATAGLQGVGEAGPEAIIPLSERVLGMIGKMIAMTMPQMDQYIKVHPSDVNMSGEKVGNITWRVVKGKIDRSGNRTRKIRRG